MASYKFSTVLSVAVLSCISCVATAETEYCQGPCPAGWVYNNWRCFKYFTEETTWIDAEEGTWLWSDGNPLHFTKWNSGEPNNSGNDEHCTHSNFGDEKNWNDATCSDKFPYICAMRFHY